MDDSRMTFEPSGQPTFWPHGQPTFARNLRPASQTCHKYTESGWWGNQTLSGLVEAHATSPQLCDSPAFIEQDRYWDWLTYHTQAGRLAQTFCDLGFQYTDRIMVSLPDSGLQHCVYLAAERAGLIVVGVSPRAGLAELSYLANKSGAVAFLSLGDTAGSARLGNAGRGNNWNDTYTKLQQQNPQLRQHIRIDDILENTPNNLQTAKPLDQKQPLPLVQSLQVSVEQSVSFEQPITTVRQTQPGNNYTAPQPLDPFELFFLNSTSGTTGLPKCVMQTQNRWFYFHQLAETYGQLTPQDRFLVAVPAPFGFGLWTSHFTPTILGAPTVLLRRFSPELLLRLAEREQATVLCAVTTQFIMMLNSSEFSTSRLGDLRVLFTGGEAIPFGRAQEFEKRTGASLLNFYGSNETGVLSGTRIGDPPNVRLTTGGAPVPEMQVRILDPETHEVLVPEGAFFENAHGTNAPVEGAPENGQTTGVPACKGPATALGYYDDDAANAQLFTADGWMLMGDIVRVADGCLQVVGRTSDFIIRGGKNISAPAVEAEVMTHPAVLLAATVPAPDEIFGERVAVYAELRAGEELTLEDLCEYLLGREMSKEWLPEHLVVVENLPRSSGGKVAKGDLKKDIISRLKNQHHQPD